MATITASSFASTSSHVSYGAVSSGSNPKTGFKKMSFGKTDPDSESWPIQLQGKRGAKPSTALGRLQESLFVEVG